MARLHDRGALAAEGVCGLRTNGLWRGLKTRVAVRPAKRARS